MANYKDEVIKHHDKYAKSYNRCSEWRINLLKKYSTKNSVLLDIGCGNGNFAIPISPFVKKVYGIDFCKEMLKELDIRKSAKNIDNIETHFLDITTNKMPVKNVDMVYSFSTLYYISEIETAIKQIYDILKPKGGTAILEFGNKYSIENYWSKRYGVPQFNININYIKEYMVNAGFQVVDMLHFQLIPEFFDKDVPVNNNVLKHFAFRVVFVVKKL